MNRRRGVRWHLVQLQLLSLVPIYPLVTSHLRSRGHSVDAAAVMAAERRARMRLDVERSAQAVPGRTGEGRYVRYLLDTLGIAEEAERRAIAEWRRGFNVPIGLCQQADPRRRRLWNAPALWDGSSA